MFDHAMRFHPTPQVPGTGWFTREGLEHAVAGHDEDGHPYAVLARRCGRCGGAGGSDKWGPAGSNTGWTCFECTGSGHSSHGPERLRLYLAAELERLNAARDKRRATKAEAHRVAQDQRLAAQALAAQARADRLRTDPFYTDFRELMGTYASEHDEDPSADWDGEGRRPRGKPPAPEFLEQLFAKIVHTDLSERERAAVEKFVTTLREDRRKRAKSDYIGREGDRVAIDGKVVACKTISYGQKYAGFGKDKDRQLVKIETTDEQTVTWFTDKWFERGDRVVGKATVKKLGEFQGRRETTITNFKISERVSAAV